MINNNMNNFSLASRIHSYVNENWRTNELKTISTFTDLRKYQFGKKSVLAIFHHIWCQVQVSWRPGSRSAIDSEGVK